MGRATVVVLIIYGFIKISIHALRGEGDVSGSVLDVYGGISIHALRGEGDGEAVQKTADDKIFQSTPSVGRATAADTFI